MELQRALDIDELIELTRHWGNMPIEQAALTVKAPFLTGENQMLTSRGRRAEICYVMHRGKPADGVLLHIKTFYPTGAFRLPTGGIQTGEKVEDTLVREIYEETGLVVGPGRDQVQVERLLGVLAYDLLHRELGLVEFATYHFLVRMPPKAELQPQDADESIGGWQWVKPEELRKTADVLDAVRLRSLVWAGLGPLSGLEPPICGQFALGLGTNYLSEELLEPHVM